MKTLLKDNCGFIVLAIVFSLLPFVLPYKALATEVLIFALAVIAFDLLLGYTGVMMFCQASFFGTAVYATALSIIHLKASLFPAILAGVAAASLLALIFGFFATLRKGSYSVLLTLAFNEMIFFIAYQWKSVTGGDDGLRGITRPPLEIPGLLSLPLDTELRFYFLALVFFLFSFFIIKRIIDSPFGKVLVAIRENESRAEAIGYNTRIYKLISFEICGIFIGLAGALYVLFLNFAHISNVAFDTSGNIVMMTLIGGIGTLFGPIVGAFLVVLASEKASALWARWPLILGVIFVLFVLFARGGIWGLLTSFIQKHRKPQP
jgi:branched-chain amino acid transport system permease protein